MSAFHLVFAGREDADATKRISIRSSVVVVAVSVPSPRTRARLIFFSSPRSFWNGILKFQLGEDGDDALSASFLRAARLSVDANFDPMFRHRSIVSERGPAGLSFVPFFRCLSFE